ncbi:hypothetical protein [Choristoneura rosaceana nucleopolyhedrovirus]|uniref:Uncharacterized protein n=1 Tax=Choristoneura rosaceana nucleopolyhedrovirus TaxID=58094 RepID=S5MKR2_9ABAC|nr:hypothetical protein [Choristoneura rosaceana nucleopolyhedrovirus]AGR57041.1 hypothetical protein [Choristoneura rosaceana nucleopolyhedrovirus]
MDDVNKSIISKNNDCFIVLHPVTAAATTTTTPISDDTDVCLNIQTQSQLVLNSATSDVHDDKPTESPLIQCIIQI